MTDASIVITNHDYGRYLAAAIDSALAQDHPSTEVVVVDDGSTDESRDILATYGDRVLPLCQANQGQGAATNAGFAASTGDVVVFLDADDTLASDMVTRVLPLFADPRTVKVHWPLSVVDEWGTATGATNPTGDLVSGDLSAEAVRAGPLYDSASMPPTSGNAWSRRLLGQVMPMPAERYHLGADEYLHSVAPVYGSFVALPTPAGTYRAHSANGYWRRPLDRAHVDELLDRLEASFSALQHHCARQGLPADVAAWRRANFKHLWLTRLRRAQDDVMQLVPVGAEYLLLDEGEWGGQLLPNRHARPFPGRYGAYAGRPSHDDELVRELERSRAGTDLLVVWWTAFWWLDHYAGLAAHLAATAQLVVDDEHLRVFDVGAGRR